MAELREESGERSCILMAEHLIGRGPQCALRLTPKYVSTQHAVIRWSGNGWELIDRASRNGTRLNGETVEPGRALPPGQGCGGQLRPSGPALVPGRRERATGAWCWRWIRARFASRTSG